MTGEPDDGIVAVVETIEYLCTDESNRWRELAFGVVREPAAPFFSHQAIALRVARLLCDHVEPRQLGRVATAPVDVVLDPDRALVLQPDVLFVATERLTIIRDQVWGPPDLVVEVLSAGTEAYDRGEKLGWYRRYGVKEGWLVDPRHEQVTVCDFRGVQPVVNTAHSRMRISSRVLPQLMIEASTVFR